MNKSEKQKAKENERRQRILDTAFRIFVEKKIEAVRSQRRSVSAGRPYSGVIRIRQNS